MTKSSVITNRLSITMPDLIIGYLFSSDQPALDFTTYSINNTLQVLFIFLRMPGFFVLYSVFVSLYS